MKRIFLLFAAIVSAGILSAQMIDVSEPMDLMLKVEKLSRKYPPKKVVGCYG
jgi:hypothetical protein